MKTSTKGKKCKIIIYDTPRVLKVCNSVSEAARFLRKDRCNILTKIRRGKKRKLPFQIEVILQNAVDKTKWGNDDEL